MKIFADNVPIYLQIKQEIEEAIVKGLLTEEAAIPSIRSLAADYAINPLTVAKAMSELESEGIIYKKRGIGFFVTAEARDKLRQSRMQDYLDTEIREFVHKARLLGLHLSEINSLISEAYKQAENEPKVMVKE